MAPSRIASPPLPALLWKTRPMPVPTRRLISSTVSPKSRIRRDLFPNQTLWTSVRESMLGHRALNVEDYFTILKRRWWIICIPAVIVPVLAVGATYFITTVSVAGADLIDQQKVPTDVDKAARYRRYPDPSDPDHRADREPLNSGSIITKYNLYASQHISMEARNATLSV